jgi:hypothetical protein
MFSPIWAGKQAKLIEKNMTNAFLAMSYANKIQSNCHYIFSHIPHPIFNCVISAQTTEPEVESLIKSIGSDYLEKKIPHSWWLSERSEPISFPKHLKNRGYSMGPQYSGMHLNLNNQTIRSIKSIQAINSNEKNIRVEVINDIKNLDLWIKPIQDGFALPENIAAAFLQCFRSNFLTNQKLIHYLAYYDNNLAGAITLFLDDDSAGIYNGAVFPELRKSGVMTALGNMMLLEAKNQGYEDVIVQANDASHSLCTAVGFKTYLNLQAYLST